MLRKARVHEKNPNANALIAFLPASERSLMIAEADVVTLRYAQVLFEDGEPADMVYFPLTSIVSMIALMENGQEIEYGSIGREGMVGLQVALNAQPLRGRAICQLEGEALRFQGKELRRLENAEAPTLQRLLLRYAQATINVLAQSTACNALHSVRQRTARWLLMTRDRAGNDTFDLTQEFLSKMLGVRRTGVTKSANDLQKEGVIDYIRGQITVIDGSRLEAAACECYVHIRDEYTRVLN